MTGQATVASAPGSAGVSPAFGRAFDRRFRAGTRCGQDAGATFYAGHFCRSGRMEERRVIAATITLESNCIVATSRWSNA